MDSSKHNKGRVMGLMCVGTFILALSTNDDQHTSRDLLGDGGRVREMEGLLADARQELEWKTNWMSILEEGVDALAERSQSKLNKEFPKEIESDRSRRSDIWFSITREMKRQSQRYKCFQDWKKFGRIIRAHITTSEEMIDLSEGVRDEQGGRMELVDADADCNIFYQVGRKMAMLKQNIAGGGDNDMTQFWEGIVDGKLDEDRSTSLLMDEALQLSKIMDH